MPNLTTELQKDLEIPKNTDDLLALVNLMNLLNAINTFQENFFK